MISTRSRAAIVGVSEWKPRRKWPKPQFALDAIAQLSAELLADAGMGKGDIDGIVMGNAAVPESPVFAPAAVAEHLGISSSFNEVVDLGGASPAGMVWRAAAAIELGICNTALVLCPAVPAPLPPADQRGGHENLNLLYMGGDTWGSAQAQFEIPAGCVAAIPSYAMAAQRYRTQYGLDEKVLAKIAVQQRDNAQHNADAIFYGKPITVDDVMASKMIADPIKLLEIVMPCAGGSALLITNGERASLSPHRPVWISGYAEQLSHKSITNMPNFLQLPLVDAAKRCFTMAGLSSSDIDLTCVYDSFTLTVLMSLEASGFCAPGQGLDFLRERDMRFNGDLPLNTHGGQLSFGQAGLAGGLSHFTEAVRQIQGRVPQRAVKNCNTAYCTGSGGMLSEQVAVILQGE
jgi:acetyl-CoA C-acetyltransferase